jgi:hypothetical protein
MLTPVNQPLRLKYRITEELAKFGNGIAAEKRKEILEALKMKNRTTLSEWENIRIDENRMIPFDYAMTICRIVGCKPEKLLNA